MDKGEIRGILEEEKYEIIKECRYQNTAWRFKLSNGTSVFCGDGGKLWASGKYKKQIEDLMAEKASKLNNNNVFIVYGHDRTAKEELLKMLEGWGVQPLAIDNLPTEGRTIIEQLEKYIPEANYGIVLATPDDKGYSADRVQDMKYRARQNVVLELGMLFAKLGRSRVAILIKEVDNFEKPSDIDGVIYFSYKKNVIETGEKLRRELNKHGYSVV